MSGTTAEGLPYPTGTDKVRDGDNAIKALAESAGTALVLPLNTSAGKISRVGMMLSPGFNVNFNAQGRIQVDVSGTFSSVLFAHCNSVTYGFVVSVVNGNNPVIEFYGQYPNGAPVTGAVTIQLCIVGVRK